MKYIKKVILENFQSHKYSEVEFDSQLNIIVGASDSGKTAIFRGIKWVLYNEPLGDFFIREGDTDCRVTIILNDGVKVERFRSKSKNSYHLYIPNKEEMIFEGFGHGVPYEISQAIGIKRINLDQDKTRSVNLAEQLDGAFLLSESGSVKASSIGRLVGVNIIDDALRDSLSDSRKLIVEKNAIDKQIHGLKEELKSYDYLKSLEIDLTELKKIRNDIYEKKEKKKRIFKLKEVYSNISQLKKENLDILEKTSKINNLQNKIDRLEYLSSKKNHLNLRKVYLKDVYDDIEKNEKIYRALINIDKSSKNINRLNHLLDKGLKFKEINIKYKTYKQRSKDIEDQLSRLKNINLVEINLKNIENNLLRYIRLIDLRNRKREINQRLRIGVEFTDRFHKINKVDYINNEISRSINKREKIVNLKIKYDELNNLREKIKKNKIINDNTSKKLLLKYENILSKQETCPLCFSSIDADRIDNIIETYREELRI